MGNPLSYRNGMTMTWQNGRQLASLQTADNSVSYKYDSNGMRTQKTDNSGTTYYYYDSDNNLIGLTKGNDTLLFYYDSDGNVTSFKYGNRMYYYVKNLQGDVVQIIDQTGLSHVDYVYDAWGNVMIEKGNPVIRNLNPFLYRSYVYDRESGLYYLQSRYYDPFTGRFLNADVYCDTRTGSPLSTNTFAYCENNSIINADRFGYWCQNASGFKKTTKGFNVNESTKFLSRTYCLAYAADFLWRYGKWNWFGKTYSGMGALRIAQELWFHALVYYIGKPLQTVLKWCGINWSWLNDKVSRAKKIEVNSNDNRAWIYVSVWAVGGYIKWNLAMKSFGVTKYAVLIVL